MRACASVGARNEAAATPAITPVVFIEGVAEPRLAVESLTIDAPLDERRLRLIAPEAVDDPSLAERWAHRMAVVALPHRLSDESVRWSVLAEGALRRFERTKAAGVEQHRLVLHDRWTDEIALPVARAWEASHEGTLRPRDAGLLVPGVDGNRSTQTFDIGGRHVHVLQSGGDAWTVGSALATISAFAKLELALTLLPRELHEAPLVTAVDLSEPVGECLRRVIEPYGLVVRREMWRSGHTITEGRHVRAMQHGRAVRLRWAAPGRPLADALRIDHAAPVEAAQRWIAEASGWQIESTFELVGGWDPNLEGASDDAYDRTASEDFATYANVYRHWALNEDGRFTESPYDRGEPFDLATFFADPAVRPQPMRLLPCVTLDDTGAPRRPIVEVSTDAGSTWSQYAGRVLVREHRAAVYLDDDTLPGAFFSAAKSGDARVRVTATLRSPQGVRRTRWRGNAFAGERAARVLSVGDAFAFRRVAEASIHHQAVGENQLAAREVDQTQELDVWLLRRMREAALRAGPALEGRGRVELAGAWPWLRPGDRLMEAGGAGLEAAGGASAVTRRGVVVGPLTVHFGVTAAAGPRTVAHVHF